MAHEITFHSFYFAYINNEPNLYDQTTHPDSGYIWTQTTGWQFIPNQCIDDFMLPFQWYRLCTAGESFKCIGVSATVQNMIPLTEQVAIQGNATFTQFNNTMYALGFNDTMYDTRTRLGSGFCIALTAVSNDFFGCVAAMNVRQLSMIVCRFGVCRRLRIMSGSCSIIAGIVLTLCFCIISSTTSAIGVGFLMPSTQPSPLFNAYKLALSNAMSVDITASGSFM